MNLKGVRQRLAAAAGAAAKGDFLAKAGFAAALCGMFYAFGAATILLKIFPYAFLRDAAEGARAILAIEDDRLPIGFSGWSEEAPPPIAEPGAGREFILMTGGPYRRLDACPTHGCLAWLIDRQGKIVHRWETDFGALIEGDENHVGRLNKNNLTAIGLRLLRDGSLLATFHGRNLFPYQVGIAKFDVDGKLLWVRHDLSHHWFDVDENGVIYTPYVEVDRKLPRFGATTLQLRCRTGAVYSDGVRVISPDGATLRETAMLGLLADYPGLFYGVADGCDPLHLNSIDIAEVAGEGVERGDLLVSLRELSAIALLDREATKVKRVLVGRTAAQHSAKFLPEGGIVVFDNMGGRAKAGGSRVLRLALDGMQAKTLYPTTDEAPMRSQYQGHVDLSLDGKRLLVTSSGEGRVIEIDKATGRELWRFSEAEATTRYGAAFGVKPKGAFARYNMSGAYYVPDAAFLEAQ